jgi:hypothetical protein
MKTEQRVVFPLLMTALVSGFGLTACVGASDDDQAARSGCPSRTGRPGSAGRSACPDFSCTWRKPAWQVFQAVARRSSMDRAFSSIGNSHGGEPPPTTL